MTVPKQTTNNVTPLNDGSSFSESNASALVGRTIEGKYRLEEQLGIGGMGTVYRATRLLIGDSVAIKILHPELVKDEQAAERFRREAQAAARLKHENVVTVYDFGITDDGLVYLVMELIEGQSLRSIIKENGALPLATAAEITRQICAALDEAHESNIVHRDIKPDNIIVRQTPQGLRVKVLDFGIAKLRDAALTANNLTQTGTVIGTPFYMSPEQCLGEEVDHRADIYSVGIILYEMLVGSVPFKSPTPTAVAVQHATQQPNSLRAFNMSIPLAVEAVVMHALQKRREARPQTAGALAKELIEEINDATVVRHSAANVPPHHAASALPQSGTNSGAMPTVVLNSPAMHSGFAPPVNSSLPQNVGSSNSKNSLLMVGGGLVLGLVIALVAVGLWASARADKGEVGSKNTTATADNSSGPARANQNAAERNTSAREYAPPPQPLVTPPPADLSAVRREVIETLEGWAAATRAHDLDAHMSYYADTLSTYYRRNNVSSSYVRASRAPTFERYYKIDVQVMNIVVTPDLSGTSATATYDKSWSFEGDKISSGEVHQMAWLSKIGGRWLITGEKDLKVIYLNR